MLKPIDERAFALCMVEVVMAFVAFHNGEVGVAIMLMLIAHLTVKHIKRVP